jgi:hypothetical protein
MARTGAREARIRHIESMMHSLEWRRGKTGLELAKKWDVSRSTVEKLASEASRRVRLTLTDPFEVSLTVAAALDRVLRDALRDGDRRSVIEASKTWAQIVGATAAHRVEVQGGVTLENVDAIQRAMEANSEKFDPPQRTTDPSARI